MHNSTVKVFGKNENQRYMGKNGEICYKTYYKILGNYEYWRANDADFEDEEFILIGGLHLVGRKKFIWSIFWIFFVFFFKHFIFRCKIEYHLEEKFTRIKVVRVVDILNEDGTEVTTTFYYKRK